MSFTSGSVKNKLNELSNDLNAVVSNRFASGRSRQLVTDLRLEGDAVVLNPNTYIFNYSGLISNQFIFNPDSGIRKRKILVMVPLAFAREGGDDDRFDVGIWAGFGNIFNTEIASFWLRGRASDIVTVTGMYDVQLTGNPGTDFGIAVRYAIYQTTFISGSGVLNPVVMAV